MTRVFRVKNSALFDERAEMAMGLHFAIPREGQSSANHREDDAFLVFNGILGIQVREILHANLPVRPRLDYSEEIDPWPEDAPQLDLEPCEDVEFLIHVLRLPDWSQQKFRRHQRVHGSPPFVGRSWAGNQFVRFSAFSLDRRITPSGGLVLGTYATSKLDADMIPTALTAVGHYALPSIMPPIYRFEIIPPPLTEFYYGTVSPAFGQSGGGTEIEFFRGVSDGAVSGPRTTPYL